VLHAGKRESAFEYCLSPDKKKVVADFKVASNHCKPIGKVAAEM